MKEKQRIAIIGAGISGLSTAHYLKLKGYDNVVLFEARDRIGGKIRTEERDGKLYEIGGVFVQETFTTIKELLAAYDEPLSPKQSLKTVVFKDKKLASNLSVNRRIFGLFKILKDFYSLWRMMKKSESLGAAQMSDSEALFFTDFEQLSVKTKIESIPSMVSPFITGMGYGHADKTPALYQLKLMKRAFAFAVAIEINNQLGTNIPGTFLVKNGYQNFLQKMAEKFDVRLNSNVQSVTRCGLDQAAAPIVLKVNDEEHSFDHLLIATPPSNMVEFLDMNEEEAFLFGMSQHYFFRSSLFVGKNLPRKQMVLFPESNKSDKLAYVNSLLNWHPESDYFTAYQLFDKNTTQEELDKQLERTVAELGGSIEKMEVQESFNYFPHYLEQDLIEHNPYQRLEALQGVNGVYYLGAALSAESADDVANYAKNLINRFF